MSYLQMMDEQIGQQSRSAIIYVATDLSWKELPSDQHGAVPVDEIILDGKRLRRLDPTHYSWLRSLVLKLKKAVAAGRMPTSTYRRVNETFLLLRDWAIDRYGEQALKTAVQNTDTRQKVDIPELTDDPGTPAPKQPETKQPEWLWPKESDHSCSFEVDKDSIAKVNAIRDHALSLGWSEARLYQNRGRYQFPYGEDYGLVCHLAPNRRIGEINLQSIEIITEGRNDETSLRFYNPDVDLPFRRKVS